jgi:hypothetical protein
MTDYRLVNFPLQLGNALTIPWPGAPVVLVRSRRQWDQDKGLRVHEECHVAQIHRMGSRRYIIEHLMARVRSRNIYAWSEPIEKECYDKQNE